MRESKQDVEYEGTNTYNSKDANDILYYICEEGIEGILTWHNV